MGEALLPLLCVTSAVDNDNIWKFNFLGTSFSSPDPEIQASDHQVVLGSLVSGTPKNIRYKFVLPYGKLQTASSSPTSISHFPNKASTS